jgi:macrolide transport system ATP-binding/permease protein
MCHSIRGLSPDAQPRFSKFLAVATMRSQNTQSAEWLRDLLKDLRYCLRRLRRTPGFALTAIAVLALGVGAATAIYAFVDATLVEPLPYREPARLVALFEHNPVGDRFHLSDFDYRRCKERKHVFTSLDVYRPERDTLNKPEAVEEVSGAKVSDGFFRTLGVTPAVGRDFFPGEDRPSAFEPRSSRTGVVFEI